MNESPRQPTASFSVGSGEYRHELDEDYNEDDDDDGIVIGGFRRVNSDEPLDYPDSIGGQDFENVIGNEIGTLENLIVQPTITAQPRPQYKIIHDWLFGSVLGEGSYAKVKEVLHTQTLERAAVKIIKKRRLRKIPNGEANVKSELDLLRRLKHKNVIHLIDFHYNPEKEKIYIFMEHCVITLQDLLDSANQKRLPTHQAHRYFTQLIDGLEYLHDSRVIHKDIKPGNLLLSREQILKISDFGVAEETDRFSNSDTCYQSTGTPRFQPPEIAAGLNSFKGSAVDIWAAAVTLFNCITGKYPFNGENIYKLYEIIEICELIIPSMAELTSDLETLLRGMLLKDFNARFTLSQIRDSVWVKRRHPAICPDHFANVARIKREMNPCSTTCYNALCHLHNQPGLEKEEENLPTLDILETIDRLSFADPSSIDVHYSEPSLIPPHGQKLPETQSEAGDRRSRLPSLRLTRRGNSFLRTLKKMF